MDVANLRTLFHEHLQDLYSSEKQILDALPEMIEEANDPKLRDALQEHLEETRSQKERLETIGKSLDVDIEGHTCKGMKGIIEEGKDLLEGTCRTTR